MMPRWQRGHAAGCRPADGSSNSIEFLPRGSKVLMLFSGGIDSPVALKLLKKYFKVTPLHFIVSRFYEISYKRIMEEIFSWVFPKLKVKKIFLVPFSDVLEEVSKKVKRKYRCLLCRRCMLLAAEMLCKKHEFDAIATAEVLAQKASQTLFNMVSTHYALKYPVLHPLLCFDKEEIVNIARKHELYLEEHLGSCFLAPKYPVTKASPEKVQRLFEKLEIMERLEVAVKNAVLTENFSEIKSIE